MINRKISSFGRGVHPSESGKLLTHHRAGQIAPLLDRYYVLLSQNVGQAPEPVVKKGDLVKKYQLIAAATGPVSVDLHAPTSGEVSGIIEIPGPMGTMAKAVEIISDKQDTAGETLEPIRFWQDTEPEILRNRLKACGLVGMGGASFPTHIKLNPPPEKPVDTLIINGAECEPFLTADHRLMLEHPEEILTGSAIMGHILGVKNIYLGIEVNKSDAIEKLSQYAGSYGITIVPLKVGYPQGGEKQLIYAVTKRIVASGTLPMDSGCAVQNVGTAFAVYNAVVSGIPLVERLVTVTGDVVRNPGNWYLKIGTPVLEAVKLSGGVTEEPGQLILGGPMMGFAQKSFQVPVSKNTSGVLLLSSRNLVAYGESPCIRCGRCVQGCPMKLIPCMLGSLIEAERYDLAEKNHVMDCIECGACAYVCPAHRPLVQHMRRAKAEIRNARKS